MLFGDPVIQATWRTDFEDGWMILNQSEPGAFKGSALCLRTILLLILVEG